MGRDRRNGLRKPDFRRLWGIAGFRQMARPANLSARVFFPPCIIPFRKALAPGGRRSESR